MVPCLPPYPLSFLPSRHFPLPTARSAQPFLEEGNQPHSTQPKKTVSKFKPAPFGVWGQQGQSWGEPPADFSAYLLAPCPRAASRPLGDNPLEGGRLRIWKELVLVLVVLPRASVFSRYCFHGAAVKIKMIFDKQEACEPSRAGERSYASPGPRRREKKALS